VRVCRYVERNALRANLVEAAHAWRWSSLWVRQHRQGPAADALAEWPLPVPRDWLARVNRPQDEKELASLRRSCDRGCPYGDPAWTAATAKRLGLESSLRPIGRPRIKKRVDAKKR
jgi:putative transposase